MLEFFAGLALAILGDQIQEGERQVGKDETTGVLRTGRIEAYPESLRPYLSCRMLGGEEFTVGELVVVTYTDFSEKTCDDELRQANAIGNADGEPDPAHTTAINQFYFRRMEKTVFPVMVSFFEPEVTATKSYTVPDGMWEYHLCRSGEVYLDGKLAQPRFPDDESCERSADYARSEATKHLLKTSPALSLEDRDKMVDGYFAEIDKRTAKRVSDSD